MSTVNIAPETASAVGEFLASVRAHLADLDPDDQREILDGLEADLHELVAERGAEALGDPKEYAAELRTAAGITAADRTARPRRSLGPLLTDLLDAVHARFDALVAKAPVEAVGVLAWFRPLWWVLRAWVAVQLIQLAYGSNPWSGTDLVPDLRGLGLFVLITTAAVSVAIGVARRKAPEWGGLPARVLLLAINLVAVGALPAVLSQVDSGDQRYSDGYSQGIGQGYNNGYRDNSAENEAKAGLYSDGKWISNIYPYDAQGKPLVGVQLFNQIGQPIKVVTQPEYPTAETMIDDNGNEVDLNGNPIDPETLDLPRIYYPWTNGTTQLYNVFPLPSRTQETEDLSPTAFSEKDKPAIGKLPLPTVPQVSLPGISTVR